METTTAETDWPERHALGYLLIYPERLGELALSADHFRQPRHRRLFAGITRLALAEGERKIDLPVLLDLVNHPEGDGPKPTPITADYVAGLWEVGAYEACDIARVIRLLERQRVREAAELGWRASSQRLADGEDPREVLTEHLEKMRALLGTAEATSLVPLESLARPEALALLLAAGKHGVVPSGFAALDRTIGGFPLRGLTLVGARTGRGKSAFLQQIAAFVGCHRGALLVTPEMPRHEVVERALARDTGVALGALRLGNLTADERDRVRAWRPQSHHLALDDTPRQTVDGITASALRWQAEGGLSLVAVDYLQYLQERRGRGEARYEQLQRVAVGLKQLAVSVGCAVVAGAQLRRETDEEHPSLSDLRESGDLEQTADVVLLLGAPKPETGDGPKEVSVFVAKNRQGMCGELKLQWHGPTTAFRDR